jgi:cold-inducible RNA-binding protein
VSSDAEAQKAIRQLNGQDLKGRALKVNEAIDKGNNRGGGGFGGGNSGGFGGGGRR